MALKKQLTSFLSLKELSSKYGLGDFDVKLYNALAAPKSGGKSDNFALTTADQWNLELPFSAGIGSELNSMYWSGFVFGVGINISVNSLLFFIKRPLHWMPTYKRCQNFLIL